MAKITFIQNILSEFQGVEQISALLKKHGHKTSVLIGTKTSHLIRSLKRENPDIAGFSLMSGTQPWALTAARAIKKELPRVKVLFGGSHPTYFPEIVEEDGVDIICLGEGEYASLDLMNALETGKSIQCIPNLWVKKNGIIHKNDLRPLVENLDSLPFPDRGLYYERYPFLKKKNVKNFNVVRGCPYDCTFCYNHKLKTMYKGKGRYVRFRSKESIVDEILDVEKRFGLKRIYFVADTMFIDQKWALDFLKYYGSEVGIPFSAVIRADKTNETIVEELKKNGCESAWFGIESGDEKYRNEILKKSLSDRQIIQTASLLKKYGIKFRTYNIMCLPGENVEQAHATINMNIRIKTDYPWCSLYYPYHGTQLVEYAKRMGFLDKDFDFDCIDTTFFKSSYLSEPDIQERLNLQRFFQTAVLFPKTFPLLKKLAKLPPNPFFDLWFQFIFYLIHVKSEGHGIGESIKLAVNYLKVFYQ